MTKLAEQLSMNFKIHEFVFEFFIIFGLINDWCCTVQKELKQLLGPISMN